MSWSKLPTAATSLEEQMELVRKADDYFNEQQWVTSGILGPEFQSSGSRGWWATTVSLAWEADISMPTSPESGSTQTSGRR